MSTDSDVEHGLMWYVQENRNQKNQDGVGNPWSANNGSVGKKEPYEAIHRFGLPNVSFLYLLG